MFTNFQVYITVPLPAPSDPNWVTIAANAEDFTAEIRIPAGLNIHSHPTEGVEGVTLQNISLQLVNSDVCIT